MYHIKQEYGIAISQCGHQRLGYEWDIAMIRDEAPNTQETERGVLHRNALTRMLTSFMPHNNIIMCTKHLEGKDLHLICGSWNTTSTGTVYVQPRWCNLLVQTDQQWIKKTVNNTVVRKGIYAGQKFMAMSYYQRQAFPMMYSLGDCLWLVLVILAKFHICWCEISCTHFSQALLINPFNNKVVASVVLGYKSPLTAQVLNNCDIWPSPLCQKLMLDIIRWGVTFYTDCIYHNSSLLFYQPLDNEYSCLQFWLSYCSLLQGNDMDKQWTKD